MTVSMLTVPIGTIIDFAGPNNPAGYLECDGRSLLVADYPQLFAAIERTWGGTVGGSGLSDPAEMSYCMEGGLNCCDPYDWITYVVRADGYFKVTDAGDFCYTDCGCSLRDWKGFMSTWNEPDSLDSRWYKDSSSGYPAALAQAQSRNTPATFNLPNLMGRTTIGAGQGTGLTNRVLGTQNLGEENHQLKTNELPLHTHGMQSHTHNFPKSVLMWANSGEGTITTQQVALNSSSALPGPLFSDRMKSNAHKATLGPSNNTTTGTGSDAVHNNMQPSAVVRKLIRVK